MSDGRCERNRRLRAVDLLHRYRNDVSDDLAYLVQCHIVARGEQHRHAKMPGDGGVDASLRHDNAVDPHFGKSCAADRVRQHASDMTCAGVIAEKHGADEGPELDALHHHQRSRPTADDLHIVGQAVDQDALAIPVRIAEDDFLYTFLMRSLAGMDHCVRHPAAGVLIFETFGHQLVAAHDPDDPFDISGNIDAHSCLPSQPRHGRG
ncbi:hypothetical protein D9M70_526430 [compost metagenome]